LEDSKSTNVQFAELIKKSIYMKTAELKLTAF